VLFTREHRRNPLCESLVTRVPDALKRLRDKPLNIGFAQDALRGVCYAVFVGENCLLLAAVT
jgi:hypothetical protein